MNFNPNSSFSLLSDVKHPLHWNNTVTELCLISKSASLENVTYSSVMIFLLAVGVVGNAMVILAVIMSPVLKTRPTFLFVASLALSDLLLGCFQTPFKISLKLHDNRFCHDLAACYVLLISDIIGNVASILNLFLIAIDRFIAIKIPFRYNDLLSTKNTYIMICVVWAFSTIWSVFGIIRWKSHSNTRTILSISKHDHCMNANHSFYATSFLGIYIPVLICIIIIYLFILRVAFLQIRAIEATRISISDRKWLNATEFNTMEVEKTQSKKKRKINKELKATKSVVIVYLTFIICWMPSAIINVIILFDNVFPELNRKHPNLFLFVYYFFVQILPTTGTMVNPLIYSFSNKQFRIALKSAWYKLTRK